MSYTPKNPNGQAVMASSSPVVIASDQSTLPTKSVDATSSGNITTQNLVPAGAATANSAIELTLVGGVDTLAIQVTGVYTGALSLQGTIDGTNWITIGGTPFLNVNTGTYLASITSALASIFQIDIAGFNKVRLTALAAVTGTAAVTLRGTEGNGMVALDAALPAGAAIIGAVTGSGNFATTMAANATTTPAKARDAVAGASDTGIPGWYVRRDVPTAVTPAAGDWEVAQIDSMGVQWMRDKPSTVSAITSVAGSASSVTVLALNAQRRGATIYNDSAAILYLKLGATASATSFTVKMQADDYYEVPAGYTGVIDGIWASATGSARVTEISS